jgi:hypothetical protein
VNKENNFRSQNDGLGKNTGVREMVRMRDRIIKSVYFPKSFFLKLHHRSDLFGFSNLSVILYSHEIKTKPKRDEALCERQKHAKEVYYRDN